MATGFRFVSSDDADAPAASISGTATLAQYKQWLEDLYDYLLLQGPAPWTKTAIDARFTRYTMPGGSGRTVEIDHGATMQNGFEVRGVNVDGSKFPSTAFTGASTHAWWRRHESYAPGVGPRAWRAIRSDRFMAVALYCDGVFPSFTSLVGHIFGDHPAAAANDQHATCIIAGNATLINPANNPFAGVLSGVSLDGANRYCWPASTDGLVESPVGAGSSAIPRQSLSTPSQSVAPLIPISEVLLVTRHTATATSGGYLRGRLPFIRTTASGFPSPSQDTFVSGGVTYVHIGLGYALPLSDNEPDWG